METEDAENVPLPLAYVALAEMGQQFRLTGKFSHSAVGKAIGASHPTVLTYVKKLEEYHRTKIVTGTKPNFRLTPEGVHLAALARVFRDSQNSLHRLRSFGRPVLRLGAFHTTFRSVLPGVLRDLRGSFDLDLIEAQSHEEILEHLQTGITDIAFGWAGEHEKYRSELNEQELKTVRIGVPCKMVAIASASVDPMFGGKSFDTLEEARQSSERLILDKDKAKLFREMGILKDSGANLVLCQNMGTIISLVQRGLGVGIVWDMGDLLKDGSVLKATFKKDLISPIQLVAFWRIEHYRSRESDKKDPMVRLVELLRVEA